MSVCPPRWGFLWPRPLLLEFPDMRFSTSKSKLVSGDWGTRHTNLSLANVPKVCGKPGQLSLPLVIVLLQFWALNLECQLMEQALHHWLTGAVLSSPLLSLQGPVSVSTKRVLWYCAPLPGSGGDKPFSSKCLPVSASGSYNTFVLLSPVPALRLLGLCACPI